MVESKNVLKSKTAEVKPEVKAEVKAEVKEAAKAEVKPAKKTATKKETAKKETAKKETAKKSAKTAKTVAKTEGVYVQYGMKEVDIENVKASVKAAWVAETGKKESQIKSIKIYVKPEENAAYYVINDNNLGRVEL